MEQAERVAFCGLGTMGGPMAANLARAGFDLCVWTHTEGKAERFAAEHGVRAADTPREAAEGAGVVITMVVDAPQVQAVLLGDQGAAEALARVRSASTCRRSPPPRHAIWAKHSSTATWRFWRRPCPGQAQGRGRHAHDHGRR